MSERDRLKIGIEPIKLRIESEPYAVFWHRKYIVMIDVYDIKRKREYVLSIEPQSLSQPIHELITTEKSLVNLEIWLSKVSEEKYAAYDLCLA